MTDFTSTQDEVADQPTYVQPTERYASLSREHSLALLHKLSTDDGFRSRFEQKPAAALAEMGVPHETIVNLNAQCLTARTLAGKDAFTAVPLIPQPLAFRTPVRIEFRLPDVGAAAAKSERLEAHRFQSHVAGENVQIGP